VVGENVSGIDEKISIDSSGDPSWKRTAAVSIDGATDGAVQKKTRAI
jgi:hypothetical protein